MESLRERVRCFGWHVRAPRCEHRSAHLKHVLPRPHRRNVAVDKIVSSHDYGAGSAFVPTVRGKTDQLQFRAKALKKANMCQFEPATITNVNTAQFSINAFTRPPGPAQRIGPPRAGPARPAFESVIIHFAVPLANPSPLMPFVI